LEPVSRTYPRGVLNGVKFRGYSYFQTSNQLANPYQ
jgi:hypothetical protein